jgi:hypothetical protein
MPHAPHLQTPVLFCSSDTASLKLCMKALLARLSSVPAR